MKQPLGVILAGGLARRMGGGDKGLLQLGGQPILRRVIDRLVPQVDMVALNANGDPARFDALIYRFCRIQSMDMLGRWQVFWQGWIGPPRWGPIAL